MPQIQTKKSEKHVIKNICFENYKIDVKDKKFDFVLAPQVLHLLDKPAPFSYSTPFQNAQT
jgi:hypothetical protein